jgi:DNA-binding response OmpR family regulator
MSRLRNETAPGPRLFKRGTASKHVLAVDDPAVLDPIAKYLHMHDFRVSTATDGHRMTRVLAESVVDLIILSLELAEEDGLTLIRELRTASEVPVIAVTGRLRDEVDCSVCLELGADDYLTKPFGLREVLARIRAILRRTEGRSAASGNNGKPRTYSFAGWELNLQGRRLTSPTGDPVPLTKGEFGLLVAFLQSPQWVLSREQLLAASRHHDDEVYDRSVDVQILRLRRKIESDPKEPRLIRTERGAGYIFAAATEVY